MGSVLSWANVADVLTDMGAVLVVTLVAVVWAVRRNRYPPDEPETPPRPGPHPPAPPQPGGQA